MERHDLYTDSGRRLVSFGPKPYDHQVLAFDKAMQASDKNLGGYCIFSEAGTGKTKMVIDFLRMKLHKEPGIGLIVCPRSILASWKREFQTHSTNTGAVEFLEGTIPMKLAQIMGSKARMFITNYEPFAQWFKDKDGTAALSAILTAMGRPLSVVVIDESSRLKNTESMFFKAAWNLKNTMSPFFLLLNGTPIEQCLSHVWPQFRIAYRDDPYKCEDYFYFIQMYFYSFGNRLKLSKYKEKEYEAVLTANSFRITLDKIKDMPPIVNQPKPVTWAAGSKAEKFYGDLLSEYRTMFGDIEYSTSVFVAAVEKLLQTCTGIINTSKGTEEPNWIFLPEAADRAELVSDLVEEVGKRTVIFTRHTENAKYIWEYLTRKRGIMTSLLIGGMKPEAAEDAWVGLESGKYEAGVFQIQSGGVGINLPSVKHIIFAETWWSARLRAQALGRAKRLTSTTEKVLVSDIYMQGTVEELVINRLNSKIEDADKWLMKIMEAVFGTEYVVDKMLGELYKEIGKLEGEGTI